MLSVPRGGVNDSWVGRRRAVPPFRRLAAGNGIAQAFEETFEPRHPLAQVAEIPAQLRDPDAGRALSAKNHPTRSDPDGAYGDEFGRHGAILRHFHLR